MQIKKIFLTADNFQRDCVKLARMIYDDSTWQPDIVLALWRGGAQPGVILSEVYQYFKRPLQHTIIKCASYIGIKEQNPEVRFEGAEEILNGLGPNQKILIVDDVFDTGRTAEAMHQRLAHLDHRFAMVYWKPHASQVNLSPHYYVHECQDWIVFPHELHGLLEEEILQKDPALLPLLKPATPTE